MYRDRATKVLGTTARSRIRLGLSSKGNRYLDSALSLENFGIVPKIKPHLDFRVHQRPAPRKSLHAQNISPPMNSVQLKRIVQAAMATFRARGEGRYPRSYLTLVILYLHFTVPSAGVMAPRASRIAFGAGSRPPVLPCFRHGLVIPQQKTPSSLLLTQLLVHSLYFSHTHYLPQHDFALEFLFMPCTKSKVYGE